MSRRRYMPLAEWKKRVTAGKCGNAVYVFIYPSEGVTDAPPRCLCHAHAALYQLQPGERPAFADADDVGWCEELPL